MECGLWLNTNYTSTHGVWLIQDLLNYFDISLSQCELIMRIPSMSEPTTIAEHYRIKATNAFIRYLKDENLDDKSIKRVLNGIEYFNKILVKMNCGYNNYYLMDSKTTLSLVKSKMFKYAEKYCIFNERQTELAHKFLDYFTKFFKEYETQCLLEQSRP